MRAAALLAAPLAFLTTLAAPRPAEQVEPPPRLVFRTSPALDLYHWVRALGSARPPVEPEEPLAEAVQAARELHLQLESFLNFGLIDGRLGDCRSVREIQERLAELPESWARPLPGGSTREVPLRALATRLARSLAAVEEHWLEQVWPAHEERLAARREQLEAQLGGERGGALYRELCTRMRMQARELCVPVVLVSRAPWPGAVTFRDAQGAGICIVGIEGLSESLLAEVVVHESIHALDLATADQETLLMALRRALEKAGLDPRGRRVQDSAHALFFVFAEELVRRRLDPEHVAYGEREGVYARLDAPVEATRALVRELLDGALATDDFLAALVEAAR